MLTFWRLPLVLIATSALLLISACGNDDKDTDKQNSVDSSHYCCINNAYYACENSAAVNACFNDDMSACTATPSKNSVCGENKSNKEEEEEDNKTDDSKKVGDSCTGMSDCAHIGPNLCLIEYQASLGYCTLPCDAQSDCPDPLECKEYRTQGKYCQK